MSTNTKSNRNEIYQLVHKSYKTASIIVIFFYMSALIYQSVFHELTTAETIFGFASALFALILLLLVVFDKKLKMSTDFKLQLISYAYGLMLGLGYFVYAQYNRAAFGIIIASLIPGILTFSKKNAIIYYSVFSIIQVLAMIQIHEYKDIIFRSGQLIICIVLAINIRNTIMRMISVLEHKMTESDELSTKQSTLISQIQSSTDAIDSEVQTLSTSSDEITSKSQLVNTSIEEMAQGAAKQSSDLISGMETLNALSKMIESVNSQILELMDESSKREKSNAKSLEYSNKLMQVSKSSRELNQGIVLLINGLTEDFQKVVSSIDQINSIASQTNLLALNASIESARAGEAGRGFAVVADEIRKLAEETAVSANEINTVIQNLSNQINESQKAMTTIDEQSIETAEIIESTTADIEQTMEYLKNSSESISSISKRVNEIDEKRKSVQSTIQEVTVVSEEFTASSEEVSSTMELQQNELDQVNSQLKEISAQVSAMNDLLK